MNDQNSSLFSNTHFSLLIILVILWVSLLCIIQDLFGTIHFEKIPKQDLVRYYDVDKKTLSKWVKYFCKEAIDFSSYKQKRKLDLYDYLSIKMMLGSPSEFPIFSKRAIIERCEGTYASLRDSIDAYPEKYGLDGATFRRLHKFPPRISQQIIQQYD